MQKLVILSSANWDGLAPSISRVLETDARILTKIETLPFGQYKMDLHDESSKLRRESADFLVFAERLEDIWAPHTPFSSQPELLIERGIAYLAEIKAARQLVSGTFILHGFSYTRPSLTAWHPDIPNACGPAQAANELNAQLALLADDLPDTYFLPVNELVEQLGRRAVEPGKYFLLGRFPYSLNFVEPYSKLLSGLLLSIKGKTTRVMVLDLDNTLWGGVIGDDGVERVALGPDFPGNSFKTFQSIVQTVQDLGIVLAISSKNTESVALEAIEAMPDMVLKKEMFVTWQINWEPKSNNIKNISKQLGLSLENFMFIDDNPVERNEVREGCPGIVVPEMPFDVAQWPDFLVQQPELYRHQLTGEDREKTKQYKIRTQVTDLQTSSQTREDFLFKLGLSIEMRPMDALSKQRVFQLIQKTNQFNISGKRYSESNIEELRQSGGEVYSVRVRDALGSDEIISVIVLKGLGKALFIDNFIMSCRVMGRGVEQAAMALICEIALNQGLNELNGQIVETERNAPCRDFFRKLGFKQVDLHGNFLLDIEKSPIERPAWFRFDGHNSLGRKYRE